jgi:hypothetical protein
MIFSQLKWDEEREGLEYIKMSVALTWFNVKSALRNAWELFITPLAGEPMAEKLIEIHAKEERSKEEEMLLRLAQRANILLAFWYDYTEMSLLIGDSGFKRQESETEHTPYKYQEKQLRDGWKTKGFNALDDLLAFLEKKDYPQYRESENYTRTQQAIVQNTAQVNEIFFINHSRLTFLRLKPHFKIVEETLIAPRTGTLYANLKAELQKETPEEKFAGLRLVLRPVIVLQAIRRLLLESGDLSDRGLFFASLKSNDSDAEVRPVADNRAVHLAKQAEMDAIAYWKLAEKYMQKHFGIEPAGGCHRRDNKNKKSFWA